MIKLLPIIAILTSISAPAQNTAEEKEEILTRTLRIMITGERALPKFKKQGNNYIEIDPDSKDIAPTAFAIGKTKKTPEPTDTPPSGKPVNEYSAWPNELINIQGYTGKSTLELTLKRPLLKQANTEKSISVQLKNYLNPLIIVHRSSDSKGWNKPGATVIETSPEKFPSRSIIAVNYSSKTIRLATGGDTIILKPNSMKPCKIPASSKDSFRYKVDTQADKKLVVVSNSSYRITPNSRLILIANNARGNVETNPVAIRFIDDPITQP